MLSSPEQYSSRKSKTLADWRATVKKTEAVKRMNHLLKVNEYSVNTPEGKKIIVRVNWRYLEYCLDWAELWACSYAQFVATHPSVSATLSSQVEQETLGTVAQMYPRYWTQSDFLPVSAEINKIFRNLGWTK